MACNKKTEQRIETIPETFQVLESITIKKGMCYGRCPAYTLTLDAEGSALYKCDRFCDLDGEYAKQLDLSEVSVIFKKARDLDPMSFNNSYESMVPDMPLTTLSFSFKDSTKMIAGKMERPIEIKNFEKMLIEIASDTTGWIETPSSVKMKADKKIKEESNLYIIKLKEGVPFEKWIESKAEYGVKREAVHDAKNELWQISFDLKKTTSEDFKYMIEKDPSISIAKPHVRTRRK